MTDADGSWIVGHTRETLDTGFEMGVSAAMEEVANLVRELQVKGERDLADTIYKVVWCRLSDRAGPMLAEVQAGRAARDAAAAEKQS